MRIAVIGTIFRFRKGGSAKLPVLSAVEVTDITDVSATISANITTNSFVSAVEVQYGSTPSLGSTLTPVGSPFAKSKDPVVFSVDLDELLPYSWVFYRIVVTTSKGPVATEIYHFNTLEPVELTDGNWVAMWDAEYEKNVKTAANAVAELRDTQFDCALAEEALADTNFDTGLGWVNLNGTTKKIENGKLVYTNVANNDGAIGKIYGDDLVRTIWHVEFTGMNNILNAVNIRVNYIANTWHDGGPNVNIPAGDSIREFYSNSVNPIPDGNVYIRNVSGSLASIELEAISLKRILGTHAFFGDSSLKLPYKPPLEDYLQFGELRRLIAYDINTLGTVYGKVKRDTLDIDFTIVNDINGIATFDTNRLFLGSNAAMDTFFNFQMKWLNIRSVTDSAEVIAKLNEWFSRESHELPELFNGILGTGIWNDAAIHDDAAIPVTI